MKISREFRIVGFGHGVVKGGGSGKVLMEENTTLLPFFFKELG